MTRLLLRRATTWFLGLKVPQAPMLGPLNMIHGSAESSSQLGNQNIAHNNELWDGEHHALSLSGYSGHLDTNTKMLSTSLKCLACFIKQHPLEGALLSSSLPFWELALMSGICSRQFLSLDGIALRSHLNLMLLLLWKL